MTDSTPDEKNLADEVEATEETIDTGDAAETVEDTADDSTDTSDDADEEETTEVVPAKPAKAAPTKKVSTAKKRPAPPVEEYDEDDEYEYDDEGEEPPVRRRPKPARRPAPRRAAASVPAAGATVTTVVVTVVILALLATSITFGVLWGMQKSDNDEAQAAAADRAQAGKVAADYAVRASTVDYRDLPAYQSGIAEGVAPKLKERFVASAPVLDQLFQPMQWVSKGTVLDTVLSSQNGSIYKVNAYVKVETSNVQVPSGRESVTVYNVTMDKDQDWLITDAGGLINTDITQIGGDAPAPAEGAQPPAAPAPGN
ncbi:hypothetical protein AXK57_05665 [Tsukamurella pulmonis]|uniref:hypothetical protein n=1 Tax=Tsukamurella pulmonis TaxID=47312 RepID=UPI00079562A0|nr:hypothetical protein [Tsukamurella pulmonis]KXP10874.1 hypothetical protein AXK57_05665 [Tsukamurella pulmonis]RDH13685.1 hypothetical protein DVB88_01065 [Tsukamurella pulmonis]